MAKFVIECPNCGRYAEARTGFFARKKIDCTCGYTIDVRTDRMTSRKCPHCGNMVIFDQAKGDEAVCPVCKEPINTMTEQSQTEEISCAQCGIRLTCGLEFKIMSIRLIRNVSGTILFFQLRWTR